MDNGRQMRINDEDLTQIKSLFADNESGLKVLRKVFLPELSPDVPLGQNIDMWMGVEINGLSAEDALINLKARNFIINHIEGCLNQLKFLAGLKSETVEQTKERLMKNSTK